MAPRPRRPARPGPRPVAVQGSLGCPPRRAAAPPAATSSPDRCNRPNRHKLALCRAFIKALRRRGSLRPKLAIPDTLTLFPAALRMLRDFRTAAARRPPRGPQIKLSLSIPDVSYSPRDDGAAPCSWQEECVARDLPQRLATDLAAHRHLRQTAAPLPCGAASPPRSLRPQPRRELLAPLGRTDSSRFATSSLHTRDWHP